MRAYLLRRVLLAVPTLFLVTVSVFLLIRMIPGSVIDLMVVQMADKSGLGTELTAENIEKSLGLDVPIHVQYVRWVSAAVRGDLGDSLWESSPVTQEVAERLPISLELGILALAIALLIAIPVGIYSAMRQDTFWDYVGRTISILGISLPTFWVGTMVIVYPSVLWGWAPEMQYIAFQKDPVKNLVQFLIPAGILGMALSGTTMRMTRTMMLEVLRQDYIRTAWAKGLKERVVVLRHALRNAFIPVVTIVGMMVPVLIGGSVIIEEIFSLPGMGRLIVSAINSRDYPVISGVNLMVATIVLLTNLLIDASYSYLNPRIQYR